MKPTKTELKEAEEKLLKIVEKFLLNYGTVGIKRQDWPDVLKEKPLTGNAQLKEDLAMDSLDTVELILQIEEEYNVRLEVSEFKDFKTLREAADHFAKTCGEACGAKAKAKVKKLNNKKTNAKNSKGISSGAPKRSGARGRPKKPK
jgi:acyl carrier protein